MKQVYVSVGKLHVSVFDTERATGKRETNCQTCPERRRGPRVPGWAHLLVVIKPHLCHTEPTKTCKGRVLQLAASCE
jgi:hypothetical protein